LEARPYQTLQIKVQTYNNNPWQKNNHTDDKENEGEIYIHAHTKKRNKIGLRAERAKETPNPFLFPLPQAEG